MFTAYRKEAAEGAAMGRREFLAGWYAANAGDVLAGIQDPVAREAASADVAGLASLRPDAVERYVREALPVAQRQRAEAAASASRSAVGVAKDGAAVDLGDGRSAFKGERGWTVVAADGGRSESFGPDGRVVSRFDASKPDVVLAGPCGFPVGTHDADPARIEAEVLAADKWGRLFQERGLGFLTGSQLKQLEGVLRSRPDAVGMRLVSFTETPGPEESRQVFGAVERALGFGAGELFDREGGSALRRERIGGDPEAFLSGRFVDRGLVALGGGLSMDALTRAIGPAEEGAVSPEGAA